MLRENSPEPVTTHPVSREQQLQLTDIPADLSITRAEPHGDGGLAVWWSDGPVDTSTYHPGWLRAHPLGRVAIALAEAPEFVVTVNLKAGEMLGFDNRRMLHGRGALDRSTGDRWLRGCCVEREELASTLRVLAR